MKLELIRADVRDAETIWRMQIQAFAELFEKYQDFDTSPGKEPLEKTIIRLEQPFTYYYFIQYANETVGAIRVVDEKINGVCKRISPLFVLSQYRNKQIAQETIREVERLHGDKDWLLDTVESEAGNCHLYEKMGYKKTGDKEVINDKLTLIFYSK